MKNVKITIVAAVAAVMSCAGVASAIPVTDTLADLANGGMIGIGDKVFSGFTYNDSGLTSFSAANIQVTASVVNGIYYLDWTGNISLTSETGPTTADLALGYTVTAQSGVISELDANFTGSAAGGTLSIDETAKTALGQVVGYISLNPAHLSDPPVVGGDLIDIVPPQSVLYVTKDLSFGITSENGGLITVSDVEQSFHQTVPDGGTTVLLLGVALSGMALFRKKLLA